MSAISKRTSMMAAALAAASMFLFPTAARGAQPDVQAAMRNANIQVSRLNIVQAEGITIVKGQVTRREDVQRVADVIRGLGYGRVANMVRIVPLPDDELLLLEAERRLALTRSLAGCDFTVDVKGGNLSLRGTVDSEQQKDLAINVLEQIEGVLSVRAELKRT